MSQIPQKKTSIYWNLNSMGTNELGAKLIQVAGAVYFNKTGTTISRWLGLCVYLYKSLISKSEIQMIRSHLCA